MVSLLRPSITISFDLHSYLITTDLNETEPETTPKLSFSELTGNSPYSSASKSTGMFAPLS